MRCDTRWLEGNLNAVVAQRRGVTAGLRDRVTGHGEEGEVAVAALAGAVGAGMLVRQGAAWTVTLRPEAGAGAEAEAKEHHTALTRIQRQALPDSLSGTALFSFSGARPTPYTITLAPTTNYSSQGAHRMSSQSDPSHIPLLIPGRIIELDLGPGDVVHKGDVICVVQQMKMKVEVQSPKSGIVEWVCKVDEGEEVGAGTLVAVVGGGREGRL